MHCVRKHWIRAIASVYFFYMSESIQNSVDGVVVLIEDTKTFFKIGIQLKIIIISHTKQSCLEVVSSDTSSNGTVYPRIYLDVNKILSKSTVQASIKKTLGFRQEACDRLRMKLDRKLVLSELRSSLIVKYVLDRISMKFDAESGESRVWMQPTFDDVLVSGSDGISQFIDVECAKPTSLAPYHCSIGALEET